MNLCHCLIYVCNFSLDIINTTNSDFTIPLSLQPNVVYLIYFKLRSFILKIINITHKKNLDLKWAYTCQDTCHKMLFYAFLTKKKQIIINSFFWQFQIIKQLMFIPDIDNFLFFPSKYTDKHREVLLISNTCL